MNKYLILSFVVLLFILNGCKSNNTQNDSPSVTPQVSIQSISYPSFAKSVWNQVIGGTGLIEFDLKDAKDSTSTRITDSTSMINITTYNKVLASGIYDIHVNSKDQSNVADTFFRFKAVQKEVSVKAKVAAVLTATSTDGLITIGQSFIQSGTVPTFKSATDSTTYKLGLINGFYYLYISGGVKGNITFTAKATGQKVVKSLSIVALNQYNMEVVTNNGSVSVVFATFSYNQVAVSSSTLINLNITPGAYIYSTGTTYFVVTDESGNILNEMKYIPGTSTIKISSLTPFTKDRFNFYQINVPNDVNVMPGIVGFLQIKKGSIFTSNPALEATKASSLLKLHLNNASFDQLLVSTDFIGYTYKSLADSLQVPQYSYSVASKLLVQKLQNNQSLYNFFDIPSGTTNYTIDMTQVNKPSLMKTISAPGGGNFQLFVYAKSDINYGGLAYNLGTASGYGQLDFYYPAEPFAEYDAYMVYAIGNLNYGVTTSGATIPDQAATFDAAFTVSGSTLADFSPSVSGTFDYYHANFTNSTITPYLSVDLYSPSAGNYTAVKLPDFSKYLGLTTVNLGAVKLKAFDLNQSSIFNEGRLFYRNFAGSFDANSKTVWQNFN